MASESKLPRRRHFTVSVADGELTLCPLTLGLIQDLAEDLELAYGGAGTGSKMLAFGNRMAANIRILTASAQLFDPSVTADSIRHKVDLEDISGILSQLLGASGMKREPRDAPDAAPTRPLNGAGSTHTSSQPQDGAGETLTPSQSLS